MKRAAYAPANFLAADVLALLILDPTRDLTPVFILLAAAVVLVLAAKWMPGRCGPVRMARPHTTDYNRRQG